MKLKKLGLITTHWVWKHRFLLGFFFILLVIYWLSTWHNTFPDEFDNIVGGWYITKGILPYTGFFTHHNPGAYYIASIIALFTGQSFVVFRLIWSVVLFAAATGSFFLLRKRLPGTNLLPYLGFLLIWGLFATYSWGHMLLSETIVAHALIPAYALIFLKVLHQKRLNLIDIAIISISSAISLLTSFTFIFAIVILWLFSLYYFWKTNDFKKLFPSIGIILAPYLLFFGYLLITGSASEFYYDSIVYNRDFYIYNFPQVAGVVSKHPIRFAISIFHNTTMEFYALFVQVRNFNFSYPVTITLLLGNLGLITYLVTKRRFAFAATIYIFLTYLNARSGPLSAMETDFHSTVYFMVSLFNITYLMYELYQKISEKIAANLKFIYQLLFAFIGIYAIFGGLFITRSFLEKVYARFMGNAPAIYDRPVVAPIINKIVTKDDYFWIGPFEFQELLYINGKLPSKYHWFLPASERSEKIRAEIIADFTKNRPKLIVFKDDYGAFGTLPSDFNYPIVNFLTEHYFRLGDLEKEGQKYKPLITNLHNFDIMNQFYFDKNRKDEIIEQLLKEKIIE